MMKRYLLTAAVWILGGVLYAQEAVKVFTVDSVTFRMVYVEGATFMMGAHPSELVEGDLDEQVQHKVKVNSFYMLECPVTRNMFSRIYYNYSENDDMANYPEVEITLYEVNRFLQSLSGKLGEEFRLPTEAEWEFAARGGRKSKGFRYSGSDLLENVGWYEGNSDGHGKHDVMQLQPNELGLYDMSGLVCEYCLDWFEEYPEPEGVLDNPTGPEDGILKVARGGCFNSDEDDCRVVKRGLADSKKRLTYVGFRFVLPVL